MNNIKCNECGTTQEVSRDGWLVESYQTGKKETKYYSWTHVVGHRNKHGKVCKGSGRDVVTNSHTTKS